MITHSDFLKLVVQMRTAQKYYFVNHSQSSLARSKQLKKRVDAAALELIHAQPQQAIFMELRPDGEGDTGHGLAP